MLFVRRIPPGVLFALGVIAFLACKSDATKDDEEDDNQFREDVIQCEEAIARLERCCPDFDGARVLCNYFFKLDTGSCGPSTTDTVHPALSLPESRCVLDTSCEDLVGKDVCARAQEARVYTTHHVTGSDTDDRNVNERETHPPVCP